MYEMNSQYLTNYYYFYQKNETFVNK